MRILALLQLRGCETREGPFYIRREEVMRLGNEGRTKVFLPVTAERE